MTLEKLHLLTQQIFKSKISYGLKNSILYGHKQTQLNCGFTNFNTGSYRKVAAGGWDRDDAFTYADDSAFAASWVTSDATNIHGESDTDSIEYIGANLSQEGIRTDILGSALSNTANVTRIIWDVDSFTAASNSAFLIMLQSITNVDTTTARDGLGLRISDTGSFLDLEAPDGETPASSAVDHRYTYNPAAGINGLEFIRPSATLGKINLFSTPYGVLREGSGNITIASTNQGWRYFAIIGSLSGSAVNSGTFQPNFQCADGVTVAP